MKSVYLETTVIGNIAGRLHPDPIVAARQVLTRRWWENAAARYELFASKLVVEECEGGDPLAAAERIAVLDGIALVEAPEQAKPLAELLVAKNAVPSSQPRDAAHIAIAAVNAADYLVT